MAWGWGLEESVYKAKEYLSLALENAWTLGKGISPVDHLVGVASPWSSPRSGGVY
jgi:hydroxymethylpyrimidine/phosphomethylpyrimidine kinase